MPLSSGRRIGPRARRTLMKQLLKQAVYRLARPATWPLQERIEAAARDAAAARVDSAAIKAAVVGVGSPEKYESELAYWRWFIKEGGAETTYQKSYEAVFAGWMRDRIERLGRYLDLPAGQSIDEWCAARSVVEMGAGPYPAIVQARKGWLRAVACDPLAKRYAEEGLLPAIADRIVYLQAGGESVPLASGFADIVINENCLDHVEDPAAVAKETLRLLKPGGLVWLYVDLSNHRDHMHPHPMSVARVKGLFSAFDLIRDDVYEKGAHPESHGAYRAMFRKPMEVRHTSAAVRGDPRDAAGKAVVEPKSAAVDAGKAGAAS